MKTKTPDARLAAALLAALLGAGARGGETLLSPSGGAGKVDVSVTHEAEAAVARALDWLADEQHPDGSWSDANAPALTALPLWAFCLSSHPARSNVVPRAVAFLRGCAQRDGGIYRCVPGRGPYLPTYNTAVCTVALSAVHDPALAPLLRRARRFIAAGQHYGGDVYDGGFGYDRASGAPYADLGSSLAAFEAMRLTQAVDTNRSARPATDLDWAAARRFLERLQGAAPTNGSAVGGFGEPSTNRAAAPAASRVVLRAYGSLTYAGLLSLIYANVQRDDPRVRSAFDWAASHWNLDENPGMGQQGLYYFYSVLTRALAAYGCEAIPVRGGPPVAWRQAVIETLLAKQRGDTQRIGQGYWENPDARFWEHDRVLDTAYAVLAIEIALGVPPNP